MVAGSALHNETRCLAVQGGKEQSSYSVLSIEDHGCNKFLVTAYIWLRIQEEDSECQASRAL